MSFDIDTYALKTQIKGFGKKKEDDSYYFNPVTYTSPESQKWGIRIQDPIEDERYTIQNNMIEYSKATVTRLSRCFRIRNAKMGRIS